MANKIAEEVNRYMAEHGPTPVLPQDRLAASLASAITVESGRIKWISFNVTVTGAFEVEIHFPDERS